MDKFARSFALTKQSWSILRANPQLSLFPIVSTIVSIIVMASFALPAYFLYAADFVNNTNPQAEFQPDPLAYVFTFVFYLVSYFVVIFFNAGLIYCANEIFAGREATFQDGIRNSFKHIGAIFVYAVISATVGTILRFIADRAEFIGAIVVSLIGFAWTIATYFVAPILVVEGKRPFQAIKESAMMLKQTWGENLIVNASLNIIFGILSMIALIPLVGGIVLAFTGQVAIGLALIAGAVLFLIVICLISSTLTGVFQTALYIYARTGQVPAAYDPTWMRDAFSLKPQKGIGRKFF